MISSIAKAITCISLTLLVVAIVLCYVLDPVKGSSDMCSQLWSVASTTIYAAWISATLSTIVAFYTAE